MATIVGGNEGRSYSDINMTPLIDVMLVLLIIFIITIPVTTHAVSIDSPLPANPPPIKPEVINSRIDFDGTLLWSMMAADRATMQGYVNSEPVKLPQPEVHITIDKFAKY